MILHRFSEEEKSCVYLPDQQSLTEYEVAAGLTPEEYEARMNAGWRKFGRVLFRPNCPTCRECRPIRIPIEEFAPDRSQTRNLRRNADLIVRYGPPVVDTERVTLYNRYQAAQETRKGWPEAGKTEEEYGQIFLINPLPMAEVSVWEGETLRAVALTEITPNTLSGVYHYHEPDCRERGLGVFVMLHCLELTYRLQKPYAYFGYYVADCASLNYKARFRPCEIWDENADAWIPPPGTKG